jgi:hypothetical protein
MMVWDSNEGDRLMKIGPDHTSKLCCSTSEALGVVRAPPYNGGRMCEFVIRLCRLMTKACTIRTMYGAPRAMHLHISRTCDDVWHLPAAR